MKYIIVILIGVIAVTGCGKKELKKDTPKKGNNQPTEEVREKARVEDFEVSIINKSYTEENSIYQVKVINKSEKESYFNELIIHVKDEMNNEVGIVYGVIKEKIEGKGERVIECSYGDNLSMYNHEEIEIIE